MLPLTLEEKQFSVRDANTLEAELEILANIQSTSYDPSIWMMFREAKVPDAEILTPPDVYEEIVAVTEIDSHYALRRPMFFRITRTETNVLAEWDVIREQVTGRDSDEAVNTLKRRICELYDDWTDPLRVNAPEENEKLQAMQQFIYQVSDPDDQGWLRAAARTRLPRE